MNKNYKIIAIIVLAVMLASFTFVLVGCNAEEEILPFDKADESKDGYATVYIPEDRDFNILLLSDPQIDTTEKYKHVGALGNDKTYDFVEDFVRQNAPDLVVINGDLVMHDSFTSSTPYFDRYAEIFERLKVPWTFAFGNHDVDGGYVSFSAEAEDSRQCTKQKLIEHLDKKYKYCLINSDANCADGSGNHFVNVRRKSGELVYTLCVFDCVYNRSGRTYTPVPTKNQVEWYKNTINAISDSEYGEQREEPQVVKSMIFNHVGVPEFYTAWQEAWNDGNPTEDYFYGHRLEGNYTSKYGERAEEEQIFYIAKNLKSTTDIFMCHHHDNDMSVNYQGIRLTFGQHSGFSHYYRTQQSFYDGILPDRTNIKNWRDISFKRIDDYGDERGGVKISISSTGERQIARIIAREVMSNYFEDYYIDYDLVAQALDANPDYDGIVERGENRLWKRESIQ